MLWAKSSPILKLPKNDVHVQVQKILLLSSDQFELAISCPSSFNRGRVNTFLVCLYSDFEVYRFSVLLIMALVTRLENIKLS